VITVGTLFSGIGVPDLAASLLGMDVRFQVEIKDFPTKVLEQHAKTYWPHVRRFRDVCAVTGSQLGYVDILIGGFPCQDVSLAGGRAGMGEGTRSNLWFEFARLIDEIQPRCVLIENVPGILSGTRYRTPAAPVHQHSNVAFLRRLGRTAPPALKVVAQLAEMGYRVTAGCISAAELGASHKRERWWCVAYASGFGHNAASVADELPPDEDGQYQENQSRREFVGSPIVGSSADVAYASGSGDTGHIAGGDDSQLEHAESYGLEKRQPTRSGTQTGFATRRYSGATGTRRKLWTATWRVCRHLMQTETLSPAIWYAETTSAT